jgi:hypothetical protein
MRRKPAILISLIVLLLIGGGGVAFYLHLCAQDIPTFTDMESYMPELPESMGWAPGSTSCQIKHENALRSRNRWLRKLGIDTDDVHMTRSYFFTASEPPGKSWTVTFEASDPGNLDEVLEAGLHAISVTGEPAEAEKARRALLEKFPALRHILRVNP